MNYSYVNRSLVAAVMTVIAACGGGGDDEDEEFDVDDADASGIWTGTLTPDGQSAGNTTVIAAPDGRFVVVSARALFVGSGTTDGNSFSGSANGYAGAAPFASGATSAAFTWRGTVSSRGNLNGSYSGANESGVLAASFSAALTDRASSLAIAGGSYVGQNLPPGTSASLAINNGVMTFNANSGCSASGTLQVIDASRNVYSWSMTFTNCTNFSGTHTGLGFMPNTSTIALYGDRTGGAAPFALVGAK